VLVLTTYTDDRSVIDALRAGARGYLTKDAGAGEIREAEVLAPIAQGLSNIEIAGRLVVSETTVKSHINHLFAKTGVRDRAQAVTYAYQHGLT
jgi:DNA-binding NarL/FixJ family response regulator